MRHANRMKMVDFQPGWDSLIWCWEVKSKMSFFSVLPNFSGKENTWRFYLYWGIPICKSRANLIFQVLPDYIWILWAFALKRHVQKNMRLIWIQLRKTRLLLGSTFMMTWKNKVVQPVIPMNVLTKRCQIRRVVNKKNKWSIISIKCSAV